jgi:hypothetical protein
VRDTGNGATLRVRVVPRAAREGIGGARGGALVVRVSAAPVEGRANRALIELLARHLDLAPASVELVRGATGREKLVRFAGLTARQVRDRLAQATG